MAERRGSRPALASMSPAVSQGGSEPHTTSLPDWPAVPQSNARTRRWIAPRIRTPGRPRVTWRLRPLPKCAWSPNVVQFHFYCLNYFVQDFVQALRVSERLLQRGGQLTEHACV